MKKRKRLQRLMEGEYEDEETIGCVWQTEDGAMHYLDIKNKQFYEGEEVPYEWVVVQPPPVILFKEKGKRKVLRAGGKMK
jgi:hypothetical protein